MNKKKDYDYFNTLLVQNVGSKVGPVAPTITPSAAFGYANAQEAEAIFAGEENLPLYARMGNPTNSKLESLFAALEGGANAIVTSSGMGALSMVTTAFLSAGDNILCVGGFFGGTYTLANETLKRFGIKSQFVTIGEWQEIESSLQGNVKMLMVESIGNPSLSLPDIQRLIDLANKYDTLILVDNTTTTPILLRPIEMGADIVIHSSTKNISGHSAALGGVAIFRHIHKQNEKLNHKKYKDIHPILDKMGDKTFLSICKKRAIRDIGMTANPFGSFLTLLGLETLSIRMERINKNVSIVVKELSSKLPKHISINHPSLSSNADHHIYLRDYPDGCGALITLDCNDKKTAFDMLNKLKLVTQTANIGDNRTLALHMTSTIYRDFDAESRQFLGVHDGLVRISIGLENPQTIAEDFLQALS